MKLFFWALIVAGIGVLVYAVSVYRRRQAELQRASDARMTAFLAEAKSATQANPQAALAARQQRLLFEAAAKAAEAGEPALSIQLYARLIARYPEAALAAQARGAVEVQKTHLSTARAPDTSAPG